MPEQVTSLLAELTRVVQQISDDNGKGEGRPVETSTYEPDTASLSNNSPGEKKSGEVMIKAVQAAGLVVGVGVDKNNPMKLERIEVMPEEDGRVRIIVSAKKVQG
jgi:hypothetical protein